MTLPRRPLPRFASNLAAVWHQEGRVRLTRPLVYLDANGRRWVVPAGFVTDLESIPAWLPGLVRAWLPSKLEAGEPGTLHDWLYHDAAVSRAVADAMFRRALRADGHGRLASWAMWAAVRLFGGRRYASGPRIPREPWPRA